MRAYGRLDITLAAPLGCAVVYSKWMRMRHDFLVGWLVETRKPAATDHRFDNSAGKAAD